MDNRPEWEAAQKALEAIKTKPKPVQPTYNYTDGKSASSFPLNIYQSPYGIPGIMYPGVNPYGGASVYNPYYPYTNMMYPYGGIKRNEVKPPSLYNDSKGKAATFLPETPLNDLNQDDLQNKDSGSNIKKFNVKMLKASVKYNSSLNKNFIDEEKEKTTLNEESINTSSNINMASNLQTTKDTKNDSNNYPPSLREYVNKCLTTLKGQEELSRVKDIIAKAFQDGSVWTKDWNQEPLPSKLNNPRTSDSPNLLGPSNPAFADDAQIGATLTVKKALYLPPKGERLPSHYAEERRQRDDYYFYDDRRRGGGGRRKGGASHDRSKGIRGIKAGKGRRDGPKPFLSTTPVFKTTGERRAGSTTSTVSSGSPSSHSRSQSKTSGSKSSRSRSRSFDADSRSPSYSSSNASAKSVEGKNRKGRRRSSSVRSKRMKINKTSGESRISKGRGFGNNRRRRQNDLDDSFNKYNSVQKGRYFSQNVENDKSSYNGQFKIRIQNDNNEINGQNRMVSNNFSNDNKTQFIEPEIITTGIQSKKNRKGRNKKVANGFAMQEAFKVNQGDVVSNKELLEKRQNRFKLNEEQESMGRRVNKFDAINNDAFIARFGIQFNENSFDTTDNISIDWTKIHVVGTSTNLERPYLRLTSAPDPEIIRPASILYKSLLLVQSKWCSEHNYHYACEQLKSIRQDLMVQNIRDSLSVAVYETHCRIALEMADREEFNQCQTQLQALYEEGQTSKFKEEFIAYQIIYHMFTNSAIDLNITLGTISPDILQNPMIQFVIHLHSAWSIGNYHRFFRLYSKKALRMSAYLIDWFIIRERKLALEKMIRAYKQSKLSISFLVNELAFTDNESCKEFIKSLNFKLTPLDEAEDTFDCKLNNSHLKN
ncbi:unnamed protein product [Gordionus sp. m RMFG-2023]|uniref:leukocyte receptor cluster member 8 homolog isoform X2 n=1 Tax=Gordionus sp. m RMFG-2023 TaxID=3053472 RepID=UPI0030E2D4F6